MQWCALDSSLVIVGVRPSVLCMACESDTLSPQVDSFQEYWTDGWNVFDFIITLFSLLPEVIFLFQDEDQGSSAWLPKLARQLRVLRGTATTRFAWK